MEKINNSECVLLSYSYCKYTNSESKKGTQYCSLYYLKLENVFPCVYVAVWRTCVSNSDTSRLSLFRCLFTNVINVWESTKEKSVSKADISNKTGNDLHTQIYKHCFDEQRLLQLCPFFMISKKEMSSTLHSLTNIIRWDWKYQSKSTGWTLSVIPFSTPRSRMNFHTQEFMLVSRKCIMLY